MPGLPAGRRLGGGTRIRRFARWSPSPGWASKPASCAGRRKTAPGREARRGKRWEMPVCLSPSALKSAFRTLPRATGSSRCKVALSSTGCQADAGSLRPPSRRTLSPFAASQITGCFGCAGILRAKGEAGGELVSAAAHDDPAGLGLPGAPHRLPRALERAEGPSASPGIGIAAIGGDIERALRALPADPQARTRDCKRRLRRSDA